MWYSVLGHSEGNHLLYLSQRDRICFLPYFGAYFLLTGLSFFKILDWYSWMIVNLPWSPANHAASCCLHSHKNSHLYTHTHTHTPFCTLFQSSSTHHPTSWLSTKRPGCNDLELPPTCWVGLVVALSCSLSFTYLRMDSSSTLMLRSAEHPAYFKVWEFCAGPDFLIRIRVDSFLEHKICSFSPGSLYLLRVEPFQWISKLAQIYLIKFHVLHSADFPHSLRRIPLHCFGYETKGSNGNLKNKGSTFHSSSL